MIGRLTVRANALAFVLLLSGNIAAQPLAFVSEQRGVTTGVRLDHAGRPVQTDGLPIELPVQDYILNKEYSFEFVPPGTEVTNESYLQIDPADRERGFGSALADGTGVLEVGAVNRHSLFGADVAVSRFNVHLKNQSDQPANFVLEFKIPAGEVEVIDFSERFLQGHSRVEATIDYLLLSPAGPFGGTYDETTGQLLNFFVDVGRDAGALTKSDNAEAVALPRSSIGPSKGYRILPYEDIATMPTIPPFGELYLYYDMYALTSTGSSDGVLGHAMLGDPTDLIQLGGVRLIQVAIPEPSTVMLFALGLVGTGGTCRRRLARTRWAMGSSG